MVLPESVLYEAWQKGEPINLDGKLYWVGKMSYGDFFLEPHPPTGEKTGFNDDTLWPELVDLKARMYEVEI